jgi:integrase
MSRRKSGDRVLGPYAVGKLWRVVCIRADKERSDFFFPTAQRALDFRRATEADLVRSATTVDEALDEYKRHLERKGNKATSIATTMFRLRGFFPLEERGHHLDELTRSRVSGWYRTSVEGAAVDTHRNVLAETKTFFRWCVKQGWLRANPLEGLQAEGRRKHGKEQLRIDEARKWMARALELAATEPGAVAALMTLLLGMRATEIVSRQVRDLDDDARLIWIPASKTAAGKRQLEVPEVLRPHLARLAKDRAGGEPLFGQHWRDWPRKWVQRICKKAGVPPVTAHGMRGLHATLAVERGATGPLVAAAMGHESFTTTAQSYADPKAVETAKRRATMKVLEGGKKE